MPPLVSALAFAVLLATIPFTLVLKVLLRLPPPLALSHRRWPVSLNFMLIAWVTACVTYFVYRRRESVLELATEFLILALCYAFGLVLLLRQFGGVYREFIVTTGATGLGLRKTTYGNIYKVEKASEAGDETRLRIETIHEQILWLSLPTRDVGVFYDRLTKIRNEQ